MYLIQYYDEPTTILGLSVLVFVLVIIALNVLICVVCANLSNNKGHDATVGVLIGFFLGIIGLIICLFLPDKKRDYDRFGYYDDRPRRRSRQPIRSSRKGYRPRRPLRDSNIIKQPEAQEAIPKTYETKQITCPHCSKILYVSIHSEYTCPHCYKTFIY